MLSLFARKLFRVVPYRRKSDTEGIKCMNLIMLFQVLKSSDVCQCSPTEPMKHDKMWEMVSGVSVGINFVEVVLFVDLYVSGMQFMLIY